MKTTLINALETICPGNVYLQGTLSNETYPESFITFWTDAVDDGVHYDDETKSFVWDFTVIYYSSNPSLVGTVPNQIRTALKNAGFILQGKGYDIPSDEPTHTGWAIDVVGIER